jgi:hypothetical protein
MLTEFLPKPPQILLILQAHTSYLWPNIEGGFALFQFASTCQGPEREDKAGSFISSLIPWQSQILISSPRSAVHRRTDFISCGIKQYCDEGIDSALSAYLKAPRFPPMLFSPELQAYSFWFIHQICLIA